MERIFTPVGNEQIVRAIVEGIRREVIITEDTLKLILEKTLEYIQKYFNLNLESDSLDDLETMLVGIVEEYPAEQALIYGIGKAESTNIGSAGVISRRIAKGAPKALVDKLGLTDHLKGSKSLYEAISEYKALLIQIGYVKDKDIILIDLDSGDVDVKLEGNCPYVNVCEALSSEGVYDIFGNVACARTLIFAGIAEAILKKSYDTKVQDYNPPNCRVKIFEI